MAWIKVDQTLFEHEKTFLLAEKLELDEIYAAMHVIALWMWALDHAPSGVLPESDRLIARACKWDGPATPFVDALVIAGFVDDDFAGTRTIHNWEYYTGNLIRKRKANAERMRKARQQSRF